MKIEKILIAIDDSEFAFHAAEYGFELARKFNASVGMVNIIEPSISSQMLSSTDPITGLPAQESGVDRAALLQAQQSQAELIVEKAISKFAGGMQVSQLIAYGAAAGGIITCSQEFGADLIVIGTHNRTGIDRLLMGSTAEHVVRHAEIPVVVVPLKS